MTRERIIGNPIYNFQLLRRGTDLYWNNVEQAVGKVDREGTLARISKLKSLHGKLPTVEDLKAAANALNKLQEVYKLNPSQLVRGYIGDLDIEGEKCNKPIFLQEKYPLVLCLQVRILTTLLEWQP